VSTKNFMIFILFGIGQC